MTCKAASPLTENCIGVALKLPMAELVQDPAVDRTRVVETMAKGLEAAGVSVALTSEHPAPSAEWLRNDPAASIA